MRTSKKLFATLAVVGALALSACGADEPDATTSDEATSQTPTPAETDTMDPAANLVGAGCADYAEAVPEGAGSVSGMAEDPVAVAAGNNPLLTTLTAAVSGELNPEVNLVDTLNGDEFTVFAPVDDAFAALPEETVTALSQPENADMLTSILTYHVVPGQITPEEIADTMQTTVQGADVDVTGEGDSLQVNGATVICGGVQTANATVYLIDTVLTPPAS